LVVLKFFEIVVSYRMIMFSYFDGHSARVSQTDGRTDGRTDRHTNRQDCYSTYRGGVFCRSIKINMLVIVQ